MIVAVNLLGVGRRNIEARYVGGDAVHVYSVLTIGDGLVAPNPGLADFIDCRDDRDEGEYRVLSQSDANVGREMAEQILSQPRAWMIASAAMLLFAVIPGMPTSAFLVLGY